MATVANKAAAPSVAADENRTPPPRGPPISGTGVGSVAPDDVGTRPPERQLRKQYYFRSSPRGLLAWDVDRLVLLASGLPVNAVPLTRIRELDESVFGQGEPLTWRSFAAHLQLVDEAELVYPIILAADGAVMQQDARGRWRRVVASPKPLAVHEIGVIAELVRRGTIVIACGGGGAPVYRDPALGLEGLDAVVDKDLAAAVLARDLGASLLLILTDVDAVYADYGKPTQRALDTISIAEAERLDQAGAFGEGSMAPKVRAAVDFVRRTGGRAIITELRRGREAVRGSAGTTITKEMR